LARILFSYCLVPRKWEETLPGRANAVWGEACTSTWGTSCNIWGNHQRIRTASEWEA